MGGNLDMFDPESGFHEEIPVELFEVKMRPGLAFTLSDECRIELSG
jgi:hypothetical protein